MSGIATAIAVSSYVSKRSGDKAAKAQGKAADAGIREQGRQFDLVRGDTEPYRKTGEKAIENLENMLIGGNYDFTQMPGYQFRMDEGQKGVSNYMRGMGMQRSGRAIKEIERFRQGTASDEIGNYMARLFNLVGAGQGGVQASAGAGLTTGSNISNLEMAKGRAEAGGYESTNNAIQGGMSNYFTNQMNKRLMSRIGSGNRAGLSSAMNDLGG